MVLSLLGLCLQHIAYQQFDFRLLTGFIPQDLVERLCGVYVPPSTVWVTTIDDKIYVWSSKERAMKSVEGRDLRHMGKTVDVDSESEREDTSSSESGEDTSSSEDSDSDSDSYVMDK
jgi:hypothetical protein